MTAARQVAILFLARRMTRRVRKSLISRGGEEILDGVDEFGGEVFGGGDVFREMGVATAEGEVRVRTVEAATGAVLKLMLAARFFVDRLGVSDCWFHIGPR
jgi:hypothetical protein